MPDATGAFFHANWRETKMGSESRSQHSVTTRQLPSSLLFSEFLNFDL
ncbi:hypothetical protein GGD65_002485 [Bradyrhizobium sp. CIR18]|nr:hypothetical protein [Bradyrhizobium sp. CIR18]